MSTCIHGYTRFWDCPICEHPERTRNAPVFHWESATYMRSTEAQHCDINGHRLYVRRAAITRDFTLYIDGVYIGRSPRLEDGKRTLEAEAQARGIV